MDIRDHCKPVKRDVFFFSLSFVKRTGIIIELVRDAICQQPTGKIHLKLSTRRNGIESFIVQINLLLSTQTCHHTDAF